MTVRFPHRSFRYEKKVTIVLYSDDVNILLSSPGHRVLVTNRRIYNIFCHEFVVVFVFGGDECVGGVVDEGDGRD